MDASKLWNKTKSVARRDALFLGLFAVVVFVVTSTADVFEKVVVYVAWHEQWQLDEVLVLLPTLSIGLLLFLYRRWRETRVFVSELIHSEQALRQANERLETLHQMDQAIMAAQSSEQVAQIVVQFVRQQLGVAWASVTLFDLETAEARVLAAYSQHDSELPFGARFPLDMLPPDLLDELQTNDLYAIADLAQFTGKGSIVQTLQVEGVRSLAWLPLVHHGQPIGALNLGAATPHAYRPEQFASLREVTGLLTIAIQQAHYREQVEDQNQALAQRVVSQIADLHHSETQFRATFEQAAVGIAHVATDGRWLQVNQRLCAIIGYSRDELLKFTFEEITHPDDIAGDWAAIHRLVTGDSQIEVREKRYLHKNGTPVWVNLTASLVRDVQGKPEYCITVIEDISQRKHLEQAITASEEKYRLLVDNAEVSILVIDYEGRILYMNQYAQHSGSPGAENVVGKTMFDLFPPDVAEVQQAHVRRVIDSGQGEVQENSSFINGQSIWFRTNAQPLRDPRGKIYAALVIAVDVTDMKRVQQLEHNFEMAIERERIHLLSQFVQHAAHEFRTPLAVIMTDVYLMSRMKTAEEQQAKATEIEQQVKRMARLLDTLLRMTALQSGVAPVFSDVNVAEIVQRLRDIYQAQFNEVTLRYLPNEGDKIPLIQADEAELVEAFQQVIENACRFTPPDGIITLTTRADDHYVMVEIKDSGPGLADDEIAQIFKTFWRRDEAHSTPGFGLGLSITQRIVERHQGRIEVESEADQGSLFRILLPIPTPSSES